MRIILIILLFIIYRIHSLLRSIPNTKLFKKSFFLSSMRNHHAIDKYIAILQDTATHTSLWDIWLYKLPWFTHAKSWEERTTWILIQIKSKSFNYKHPISLVQDINDSQWSKLFTIYIVPLLLLVPLTLAIGNQESIYSITTRHETFAIPVWFFMVLGMIAYIALMRYIFGQRYSTQKITMENKEFEENIDVFWSDWIEWRILLTPERIEIVNTYFEEQKKKNDTTHWKTQSLFFSWDSLYIYATILSTRTIRDISLTDPRVASYIDEVVNLISKLKLV